MKVNELIDDCKRQLDCSECPRYLVNECEKFFDFVGYYPNEFLETEIEELYDN